MSRKGTFAKRRVFYNNDGMVNIIMNTNRIVSIEDIEEFWLNSKFGLVF